MDRADGSQVWVETDAATASMYARQNGDDFVATIVEAGQIVTGRTFGGKRTMRAEVTYRVPASPGIVFGLLTYASTYQPGGQYEGAYRGIVALDATTVRPA
jgi:hypothetical protein